MGKDQKKLVAIFRFGVISNFFSGAAWSVVSGRDYCETRAPSGSKSLLQPH
ncbi:hypothetical protein DFAR_2730039 [Desulfarculales bacterium]